MLFNFKGIPKIKIPIDKEELTSLEAEQKILQEWLSACLQQHTANSQKIDYLYNFYLGDQDIQTKTRKYVENASDGNKNNRTVENHAYAQVEFKKALCDTLQYTHKQGKQLTDDLSTLDNLLTDVYFNSKHQNILEFIFATGIGTSFTIPRTDIITDGGEYNIRVDKEAPFIFESVDPRLNFNIYSSSIGEKPLFSVMIIDKTKVISNLITNQYTITVYSENYFHTFDAGIGYALGEKKEAEMRAYHKLPLIEYSYNKTRIGLVEVNRDLFNLINLIKSNSADAMVDTVNKVIVFDGVEINSEQLNEMLASGAIKIKAPDAGTASSGNRRVYTLEIDFNHSDINIFYEQTIDKSYNIIGCVRATSSTNSGGTTKSGSEVANGWDNAWLTIKKDINAVVRYDYEQLKLFLDIASLVPGTKINELSASDIDIKYNLTPNDNIHTKAQAAAVMDNLQMTEEMILQKSGLSFDVNTEAELWRENKKRLQEFINPQSVSTSINGNTAI